MQDTAPTVPTRDVSTSRSRLIGGGGALATTALALVTLALSAGADTRLDVPRSLPDALLWLGAAAIVMLVAASWVVSSQRPGVAVGSALITAGLLLPMWAGYTWLPPWLRAAVLAVSPLAVAGVAQVALRWPLSGSGSRVVGLVFVLAVAACGVLLVGYDPLHDPGCVRSCVDVPAIAAGLISSRTAVGLSAILSVVAATVAIIPLVGGGTRMIPRLIRWAATLSLAMLAAWWLVRWASWADPPPLRITVAPSIATAILIGGSTLVAAQAVRRTRTAVDGLVTRLADPAGTLLGDGGQIRGLEFAVPGEGRWVDTAGRPVVDTGSTADPIVVSDRTGPVARLWLAEGIDPADVWAPLAPAARLALSNAQLVAVISSRLAEVQASRRRVVATADAERQRIERDLHDGAQQRLVSAAFHMSVARNRLVGDDSGLSRAESAVRDALGNLRRLARGIFPASLATGGLGAALEQLVTSTDIPTVMDVPELAIDTSTAMAAYATIAAAVEHAQHGPRTVVVRIAAVPRGEEVLVRVESVGGDGLADLELTDIADRVGAIGGQVTQERTTIGSVLTAVLPCASS